MQFKNNFNKLDRTTFADGNAIQEGFLNVASAHDEELLSSINVLNEDASDVRNTVNSYSTTKWDNDKVIGFSGIDLIDLKNNKYVLDGGKRNNKTAKIELGNCLAHSVEGDTIQIRYNPATIPEIDKISYFKDAQFSRPSQTTVQNTVFGGTSKDFYKTDADVMTGTNFIVSQAKPFEPKNANSYDIENNCVFLDGTMQQNKEQTVNLNSFCFLGKGSTSSAYCVDSSINICKGTGRIACGSIGFKGDGAASYNSILIEKLYGTGDVHYYSTLLYGSGKMATSSVNIFADGNAQSRSLMVCASTNSSEVRPPTVSGDSMVMGSPSNSWSLTANDKSITICGGCISHSSIDLFSNTGNYNTNNYECFLLNDGGGIKSCSANISIKGNGSNTLTEASHHTLSVYKNAPIERSNNSIILANLKKIGYATSSVLLNMRSVVNSVERSFIMDLYNTTSNTTMFSVSNIKDSFILNPEKDVSNQTSSFMYRPMTGTGKYAFNKTFTTLYNGDRIYQKCVNINSKAPCQDSVGVFSFRVDKHKYKLNGGGSDYAFLYNNSFAYGANHSICIANSLSRVPKCFAFNNSDIGLELDSNEHDARSIALNHSSHTYRMDSLLIWQDLPVSYKEVEYFDSTVALWRNGFYINKSGFVNGIKLEIAQKELPSISDIQSILTTRDTDSKLSLFSFMDAVNGAVIYMIKEKKQDG